MTGQWASYADRVLRHVFATLPPDADERAVKRAIREAYPFGERSYWPYKAWGARARIWLAAWKAGLSEPAPAPKRRSKEESRDHATGDLFQ